MKNIEGLEAAFRVLRKSLMNCDTLELDRLIFDDHTGFGLNGTIGSKTDILDNFKPGLTAITEYSVKGETYEVHGDIGIITGQGRISGSYQGHEFHHRVLFTDIFKYDGNLWKYHRAQVTEIKAEYQGGKSLVPEAAQKVLKRWDKKSAHYQAVEAREYI